MHTFLGKQIVVEALNHIPAKKSHLQLLNRTSGTKSHGEHFSINLSRAEIYVFLFAVSVMGQYLTQLQFSS